MVSSMMCRYSDSTEDIAQLPGMTADRRDAMESAVRTLLRELGEDPSREGLVDTPKRVAKAWLDMTAGTGETVSSSFGGAIFHEPELCSGEDLVIVRGISVSALSDRSLLPFCGLAHVAYVPRAGSIAGLSKLARVARALAARPQSQRAFTSALLAAVRVQLDPLGAVVVVTAAHLGGSDEAVAAEGRRRESPSLARGRRPPAAPGGPAAAEMRAAAHGALCTTTAACGELAGPALEDVLALLDGARGELARGMPIFLPCGGGPGVWAGSAVEESKEAAGAGSAPSAAAPSAAMVEAVETLVAQALSAGDKGGRALPEPLSPRLERAARRYAAWLLDSTSGQDGRRQEAPSAPSATLSRAGSPDSSLEAPCASASSASSPAPSCSDTEASVVVLRQEWVPRTAGGRGEAANAGMLGGASPGASSSLPDSVGAAGSLHLLRDVTLGAVSFSSLCEHHLLPFYGQARVAFRCAGPGAAARATPAAVRGLVLRHARRLQVQERITRAVADDLAALLRGEEEEEDGARRDPEVLVILEAVHLCMVARGVESHTSSTMTAAGRGAWARAGAGERKEVAAALLVLGSL